MHRVKLAAAKIAAPCLTIVNTMKRECGDEMSVAGASDGDSDEEFELLEVVVTNCQASQMRLVRLAPTGYTSTLVVMVPLVVGPKSSLCALTGCGFCSSVMVV